MIADRTVQSTNLGTVAPLAHEGAAAAGSLREDDPVWVLGRPLHELDAGVVLPVAHGLLEQRLVHPAASEEPVSNTSSYLNTQLQNFVDTYINASVASGSGRYISNKSTENRRSYQNPGTRINNS